MRNGRAREALGVWLVAVAALAAACDGTSSSDAGAGPDAASPADAGSRVDASPAVDAGSASDAAVDSGVSPDSGIVAPDSGSLDEDGGSVSVDSGSADPDAGGAILDSGVGDPDAGVEDAGPPIDGGLDAGTPPVVVSTTPTDGASDVGLNAIITVVFDQPMNTGTGTLSVVGSSSGTVTGSETWSGGDQELSFDADDLFALGETVDVSLSGYMDVDGESMVDSHTFRFTTVGSGPGEHVLITAFGFEPSALSISAGTQVTWHHWDGGITHTVTSMTGSDDTTIPSSPLLDSPLLGQGDTYSHTFTEAGSRYYRCRIHSSMQASVVVSP